MKRKKKRVLADKHLSQEKRTERVLTAKKKRKNGVK